MTDSENTPSRPGNNPPVERIRKGRIQAAIWKRTVDQNTFYSFTLERSYKDSDGNYQSTSSFSLQDALLVSKVADLADTKIRQLQDADYSAARVAIANDEQPA